MQDGDIRGGNAHSIFRPIKKGRSMSSVARIRGRAVGRGGRLATVGRVNSGGKWVLRAEGSVREKVGEGDPANRLSRLFVNLS